MAGRKKKNTVDYFPHYIGQGKKIQYIEAKYGNDGYATWFKILETLATTEDHYIDLNDELEMSLLAVKCRVSELLFASILDDLAKLGAINKMLWEHRIIWSETFVESIKDAYKRRVSFSLDFGNLCKHLYDINAISVDINSIYVDINARKKKEEIKKQEIGNKKQEIGNILCPENETFSEPQPEKLTIDQRKLDFKKSIDPYIQNYSPEMLNSFFSYWTEKNENGKKMRFEMQKVFEVGKRLATWNKNDKNSTFKFNQNGKSNTENRQSRIDEVANLGGLAKQIIANGS